MSSERDTLAAIETVAIALEALGRKAVFVGGSILSFFPLTVAPRITDDVDVVVDTSRLEYADLVATLYRLGFRPCQHEGAPICRLEVGANDVHVDLMPIHPGVLGFSNRWYRAGLDHAIEALLPSGRKILRLDPLHFIATKLDAFDGRGKDSYSLSEDLADIVNVLASDQALLATIAAGTSDVEQYVVHRLRGLILVPAFMDAIAWYFPGSEEGQRLAQKIAGELKAQFG